MALQQPGAPRDSVPVEFLFRFEAGVGPMQLVDGAPYGTRSIIPITGGVFEGPRLRGTVVAALGGEFATVRPNGTIKADVRLVLETDDGVKIMMTYQGIAMADPEQPGNMTIRTAPLFETGDGRYAWLNDVQAIAHGRGLMGDVSGVGYDVYALR